MEQQDKEYPVLNAGLLTGGGTMDKINAVKCLICGDIIQSRHRHDFVTCSCGNISVDGGNDYNRRVGSGVGFVELYAEPVDEKSEENGDAKYFISQGNFYAYKVVENDNGRTILFSSDSQAVNVRWEHENLLDYYETFADSLADCIFNCKEVSEDEYNKFLVGLKNGM
jgi:hypothetical protein